MLIQDRILDKLGQAHLHSKGLVELTTLQRHTLISVTVVLETIMKIPIGDRSLHSEVKPVIAGIK